MTDFRALSAELVEKIEYTWGDIPEDVLDLLDRVSTALAHPEPEGDGLFHWRNLGDEDRLMRIAHAQPFTDSNLNIAEILARGLERLPENNGSQDWMHNAVGVCLGTIAEAFQPEPVGLSDEELMKLACAANLTYDSGNGCFASPYIEETDIKEEVQTFARLLFAAWRRPTIKPVPVAERPWEREGWCDAEGRCWLHRPAEIPCRLANGTLYRWVLDTPCRDEEEPVHDTHSLPHHAMPVPSAEVG
jgi:hypothetical protein